MAWNLRLGTDVLSTSALYPRVTRQTPVSTFLVNGVLRVCSPLENLSRTRSLVKVNFMSSLALNPDAVSISDLVASRFLANSHEDVVEIGLLLPAHWAAALVELSKQRDESVGQLIRTLIGRALVENNAAI